MHQKMNSAASHNCCLHMSRSWCEAGRNMFSYGVMKAVGPYVTAVGARKRSSSGVAPSENTPPVRERVYASLRWRGPEMDAEKKRTLIEREGNVLIAVRPFRPCGPRRRRTTDRT